jgi:hypothetical protein
LDFALPKVAGTLGAPAQRVDAVAFAKRFSIHKAFLRGGKAWSTTTARQPPHE